MYLGPVFRPVLRYESLKRLKSGSFMTSSAIPNVTAATKIPPTTIQDNGVIRMPNTARSVLTSTSPTEDTTSQRLGRNDHR